MIVIHNPEINIDNDEVIISSKFVLDGKNDLLWYRFPIKFKEFLVTERLDAFMVGLLFLALKTGNNIKVEGAISARLFYTVNHYLIPALVHANPSLKKIKIFAEELQDQNLNIKSSVGTGMSCGVDSFATYFDHNDEKEIFKITHFTYFNVGSHLDFGGEKSRSIFKQRLDSVSRFSEQEKKELIYVDSNLSEILQMNFQQTHTIRNVSCVLHLQKLFKTYYYSSTNRFDVFDLNSKDMADYDILNLSLLCTESTQFFSSVSQYSRVERTKFIAEFPQTYNYLDVCVNPNLSNNKINCSKCFKCMRTLLTLEASNNLEKYQNVFELEEYYKSKNRFLGSLMFKKVSKLDMESLNYYLSKGNKYSIRTYSFALISGYKTIKKRIKKSLSSKASI